MLNDDLEIISVENIKQIKKDSDHSYQKKRERLEEKAED
jgi:hypothetical protein